jgi:hypothetical protein
MTVVIQVKVELLLTMGQFDRLVARYFATQ